MISAATPAIIEPRATATAAVRSESMPSIIAARSSWAMPLSARPMRV